MASARLSREAGVKTAIVRAERATAPPKRRAERGNFSGEGLAVIRRPGPAASVWRDKAGTSPAADTRRFRLEFGVAPTDYRTLHARLSDVPETRNVNVPSRGA